MTKLDPESPVVGVWRLLGYWQDRQDTGERVYPLGSDAEGRLILTAGQTLMCVATAAGRKVPIDQAAAAGLQNSMLAYSGKFRVEGSDKFVTICDLAWNPGWVGSEQVRIYKVDGDRLTVRTPPIADPTNPGRQIVATIEWVREKEQP